VEKKCAQPFEPSSVWKRPIGIGAAIEPPATNIQEASMRAFSVRKLVVAAVAAASLTAGLAATSSAQAKMPIKMFPGPIHMHHGYGYGGGAGAALIGGLAIGAIAAAAASQDDGCYVVTKRTFDEDGNVYMRRVTVCE
jgi:hypothetical protein